MRIEGAKMTSRFNGYGIDVGEQINTMVTVAKMIGTSYDEFNDKVHKVYQEEPYSLPFKLVSKSRDP